MMELEARIEVEYQLDFGEFYRGLRWYAWRKCWWIYCFLILGVPAALTTFLPPSNPTAHPLLAAFPASITAIFIAAWLYWGVYRNARKQFDSNANLRSLRHSIFSKDGVEGSSAESSGRASWSVLYKVLETPESFLFFNSNATFGVFPKRTLGSDERVKAMRKLIREQVGSKAKLRDE
jgi:hypothetical protein